ncbi:MULTISPECIES: hypothetical protein [Catellatospora]|uniref:Uncharacterized protein n=2 Tax=Catellatospora TaxID=53365 RepID=A0A8J3NZS9_9ACTN|nr:MULTISPECIES: hypothetical protein [Catellatospora]RKE11184.1 hypothetical protein C8E86_6108 [Catellatospora citrea]GIF90229.1 hypothetical protein Cch02nite_36730 [Catellatospora chokoriensis]GIF96650.1 hypothetical protein Cci01nite_17440 [Catellatospora citrea]
MHLVRVTLDNAGSARKQLSQAVATDLIWAYAEERDAVEHVRVQIGTDVMTIVLFIRSADETVAQDQAVEIVTRAIKAPALDGWHIR